MDNLFNKHTHLKKTLLNGLIFCIPLTFAMVISYSNLFKIARVSGNSMNPTLYQGQYLFFTKFHTIQRNDIVVFKSPETWLSKNKLLIKRVVGMPGDEIKIDETTLYVNDKKIVDFESKLNKKNLHPIQFCLCNGGYFVLGDNTGHSYDSLACYLDHKKEKEATEDYIIDSSSILFSKTLDKERVNDE